MYSFILYNTGLFHYYAPHIYLVVLYHTRLFGSFLPSTKHELLITTGWQKCEKIGVTQMQLINWITDLCVTASLLQSRQVG